MRAYLQGQKELDPITTSGRQQRAEPKPGDTRDRRDDLAYARLQRPAQQYKLHPAGQAGRKREPGDAPPGIDAQKSGERQCKQISQYNG